MTRKFVVQCPQWIAFDTVLFQCRRERGHEGNHSSNVAAGDTVAKTAVGPPVFRIDWRLNDGVVIRRNPKK